MVKNTKQLKAQQKHIKAQIPFMIISSCMQEGNFYIDGISRGQLGAILTIT